MYLVCDIIDYDDTVGPSVVAGSDGPKSLLTGSVPLVMAALNTIITQNANALTI